MKTCSMDLFERMRVLCNDFHILTKFMFSTRMIHRLLFFLFVFLQANFVCFSQNSSYPVEEWVKKLSSKHDGENNGYSAVWNVLNSKDSLSAMAALNKLETYTSHSNHYFRARFFLLKANQLFRLNGVQAATEIQQTCEKALKEAYGSGDDYLVSFSSWIYGTLMGLTNEIELSATYLLKTVKANERLEKKYFSNILWLQLGETFFHTREYEKCIDYMQQGLDNWKDTAVMADYYRIRYFNTIGQAYYQLGELDSALAKYKRSMFFVDKLDETTWRGINAGFMGQVFFLKKDFQRAKQLLQYDFSINRKNEWTIAANTLQWLARISLIEGKKDSALWLARKALQFSQKAGQATMQQVNYLQHIYFANADAYRAIGNTDSFYHYYQLYADLHDSLERVATRSSIKMTQLRVDSERNYNAIQSLQKEKKAVKQKRNFIITVIILCSIIIFFYLNRLRLKHQNKEQMALQQKNAAEAELKAKKEQLQLFTQTLIEKTSLIEKLELRLDNRTLSIEQQELITALSGQTILSEADWEKFKFLFEKIYPGFFIDLKNKVTDITISEQRMAALIRLHLTTRQIASILGISPNSVNKTKQRLRQRLNVDTEKNIEDVIAEL